MPSPLLPRRWDGHWFVLKWKDEGILRALPCLREADHINVQGFVEVHDVHGLPAKAVDFVSGNSDFE